MKKAISILIIIIGTCCIANAKFSVRDSLLHELAMAKQDSDRVLIMSNICGRYRGVNTDSSLFYGQQALKLAQKIRYSKGEVSALRNIGITMRLLGEIPESLRLIFRGLQIAEKNHLSDEKIECLIQKANTYSEGLNDYDKALEAIYDARRLMNSLSKNTGSTNKNGISLKRRIDRVTGINYMYNNQYDSASYYLQQAYNTHLLDGTTPLVTLMYMSELQFKMGNYMLALEYIRQSILFNTQNVNQSRQFSEAYNMCADIFMKMNQPDSVIYYASKALEKAQLIDYKNQELKSYNLLADAYEPIDIKKAYMYLRMAKNVNEELYGAERVKRLQKIMSEEQGRQQQVENENLIYKNRIQRLWIFSIAGALLSALLVAFVLFRNNKNKQKANALLQEQKEEIQTTLEQLKSTQAQLIQSEKMASLGELTAGIAHEIQNPLNFVNNFSEVNSELIEELKEELVIGNNQLANEIADDIKENEAKINHHGKRAEAIVKGMLLHSRGSSGKKEPTDINALCDEYLRLSYHGFRAKDKSFNADFKLEADESLPKIEVVPQDIGRVLLNLINNAFYAAPLPPEGGFKDPEHVHKPFVIVKTSYLPPLGGQRGAVVVTVSDNGPGIPDSIKDKIFQPFFTTKPTGSGTGLGLSLSYDIVKAHGGEISVVSEIGKGTEFIIQIPINKHVNHLIQ